MFFALLKGFFGKINRRDVGQNALIQTIRKVSLINSVYTYTNNFTFSASCDQPTTDVDTKSSNLYVAVSQMRFVDLVHD